MSLLKNLSIRRKLTLIVMMTTNVALLLACAAFMAYDIVTFRQRMVRDLEMHADIVAANSTAALMFTNEDDARQTLASLSAEPRVTDAAIVSPDGKVFVTYARAGVAFRDVPKGMAREGHRFVQGHLEVRRPIVLDGRELGTVFVRTDLEDLYDRIRRFGAIVAAVIIGALGVAYLLAARLQAVISAPLNLLADTARLVSAEKNYAVRTVKLSNDELGLLVDSFNDMLDEIQQRDAELKAHRDHLEEQVAERTTELKTVNAQLLQAKERAEEANRSKSAFLANMSHEIRTPITAIVGYADVMLEPEVSASDRHDWLQVIQRNARHLLHLINDILDLSKIEADRMSVERIPCDLPALVGEVASLMHPLAAEKGLQFKVTFAGTVPRQISTDPLRLKQVLMNLTSNAVKFTAKGSVGLHLSSEPTDRDTVVRIEVWDTGIGMTRDQVSRLFQPFSQADDSMTRRFGGSGLGLAISRRLARLLGGDIAVRSAVGQGTSFQVTISGGPVGSTELLTDLGEAVYSVSAATAPPKQPQSQVNLAVRVLLAEDGLDNQQLISLQLRKAGAEVVIAENGRVACELVNRQQFDLILMDMQMPELDGYAATAELRRRGLTLPIIAITAHAMTDDRAKCLAVGCTDYLAKPVEKHILLRTVQKYLPAKVSNVGRLPQSPPDRGSAGEKGAAARKEPGAGEAAPIIPTAAEAQHGGLPGAVPAGIRSSRADEPEVKELLDSFVASLPPRVALLQRLLDEQDLAGLRRAVHQLKGSGGGYGFEAITEGAAAAETRLDADAAITEIVTSVSHLIDLLRRVEGYERQAEATPVDPG